MDTIEQKNDPLSFLLDKFGFDFHAIEKIASGERYTAVLLKNGNLGVCANLGIMVDQGKENYPKINLLKRTHRIIFNAYINAVVNYPDNDFISGDIFDVVDFMQYKKTVMIGFFGPLIEKFNNRGIRVHVFDDRFKNGQVLSMSMQQKYLKSADSVVLSSTSLSNGSFVKVINSTRQGCDIYMLGPSSILSTEFKNYRNIRMVFGTCFEKNDKRILTIINQHGGTREFSKFASKTYLKIN